MENSNWNGSYSDAKTFETNAVFGFWWWNRCSMCDSSWSSLGPKNANTGLQMEYSLPTCWRTASRRNVCLNGTMAGWRRDCEMPLKRAQSTQIKNRTTLLTEPNLRLWWIKNMWNKMAQVTLCYKTRIRKIWKKLVQKLRVVIQVVNTEHQKSGPVLFAANLLCADTRPVPDRQSEFGFQASLFNFNLLKEYFE